MSEKLIYRLIIALVIFGSFGLLFFALMGIMNPIGFLPPHEQPQAANIYAQYMAARNIGIILLLLVIAVLRSKKALAFFLLLNGFIQAIDTVIGVIHKESMQTFAPLILTILFILAGRYLLKKSSGK